MQLNGRSVLSRGIWVCGWMIALGLVAQSQEVSPSKAAGSNAKPEVTFTKDVASIFQRKCQNCHRPGSIGPMSLLTYEEARPWARSIRAKVATRAMPPWFIDPNVGLNRFKDDRSLSPAEIDTIVRWVDGGAVRGNPMDMPPPLTFDDKSFRWSFTPDLVIPMPTSFTVDANSPNQWVDFISETGLTEDRWIQMIETKPSLEGFRVVHHATTSILEGTQEQLLSEYALGKTADILPEGAGRLLKAGTTLRWNLHYASVGKPTTDRTSIAFKFYPKGFTPKHKLTQAVVGTVFELDLPPGDPNIRTDSYTPLKENIRMTVYQPHLHNRGKRQCLEAILPDGRVMTINCVNWNFGWHIAYHYETDTQPLLPKGTVLHIISWHDNTSANKWNPDPRNWVGYGQRSSDDMSFAHISWYALDDQDFDRQVKERFAGAER